MSQWDAEETAILEHVYLGKNHVGIVFYYASHCEAVPDDPESITYGFMSPGDAAYWMRLRIASVDAASVWADRHSLGPVM